MPISFVVKKGSKILSRISEGIPVPVTVIVITTKSFPQSRVSLHSVLPGGNSFLPPKRQKPPSSNESGGSPSQAQLTQDPGRASVVQNSTYGGSGTMGKRWRGPQLGLSFSETGFSVHPRARPIQQVNPERRRLPGSRSKHGRFVNFFLELPSFVCIPSIPQELHLRTRSEKAENCRYPTFGVHFLAQILIFQSRKDVLIFGEHLRSFA